LGSPVQVAASYPDRLITRAGRRGGRWPPLRVSQIPVTGYDCCQGIKVTERLFVWSVSVAAVNWTVIGGLHDGLNVAVAVSV
jgi:hypothetical protein